MNVKILYKPCIGLTKGTVFLREKISRPFINANTKTLYFSTKLGENKLRFFNRIFRYFNFPGKVNMLIDLFDLKAAFFSDKEKKHFLIHSNDCSKMCKNMNFTVKKKKVPLV